MNVLDVHPYETSWMSHLPDNDSDATAGRRDAQYLTVTNLAAHSKPTLSLPKGARVFSSQSHQNTGVSQDSVL